MWGLSRDVARCDKAELSPPDMEFVSRVWRSFHRPIEGGPGALPSAYGPLAALRLSRLRDLPRHRAWRWEDRDLPRRRGSATVPGAARRHDSTLRVDLPRALPHDEPLPPRLRGAAREHVTRP